MARWDKIFSLPVQNPTLPEFSSADLVWSKVEGYRDNIDRLALIPYTRVKDFVKGESSNEDCPTSFHVEASRRPKPKRKTYKAKVDSILESTVYCCSFGPDDKRKGGAVRPCRSKYVRKKKNAGRPNNKRGCKCSFTVKCFIAEPTVALIIYNHDKHVDAKGLPCHGPQDKKAAGTRAMFAPHISQHLRLRLMSLLHVGVSVETIMQRHNESVEKQGGPSTRDDLLAHRYVRRLERSIRRSTYELDEDDDVSVGMWVESHQSHVFFYQGFSGTEPFSLGIQTEWQLQQMIRFGNCRLLASDSRFGTNKLKYPIHSLVVFDSENKAVPVAWIIAPRVSSGDSYRWMRALCNRVHAKDPLWKVAGFIVDDPFADIITIRDVFQCPVLFSFWRIRHAWHKNIIKRCQDTETRVLISRHLGQAVDKICRRQGTATLFEGLKEHFVNSPEFLDYFRAVWSPRIGAWTSALQNLPLASQEICAAMELYHYQMKCRLLNERGDSEAYQRCDWLVDKLGTKVHSYFWLDEYSGIKDDFARYWKEEWVSGLTCFGKALSIPDSDVVVVISSGMSSSAKVTDGNNVVHDVWSPTSHFGVCSCSWADKGYICQHMIKLAQVLCRGNRTAAAAKESASLAQYYQTLIDLLHCPPPDSLFRDYAVSLAVSVEKQINALGGTVQKEVADIERCTGKSLDESGEVATDLDGELSKMPMNRDRRRARSEMEMDPLLCSTKAGAEDVTSTAQNEAGINHERGGAKRLKRCSTRASECVDGNRAETVARVSRKRCRE